MKFNTQPEVSSLPTPEEDPAVWVSGNGQYIPIKQMTHSHLMNALKRLEGQGVVTARYANLLTEAISRGLIRQVQTTMI